MWSSARRCGEHFTHHLSANIEGCGFILPKKKLGHSEVRHLVGGRSSPPKCQSWDLAHVQLTLTSLGHIALI